MAWTRSAWNNFKTQPEIWFFYGFILTSSLSWRKVFFDYPVLGGFNEYAGIYLYLSDLIFLGMMAAWLFSILCNNIHLLSIDNSGAQRLFCEAKLFHPTKDVPRGTSYKARMEQFGFLRGGTFAVLLIPLILVVWSFVSIKWSDNTAIALYRSFKLFEFYLLYLFLALNLKCSTPKGMFHVEHPMGQAWNFLRNTFRIIIVIGLINAIIGIIQVVLQHSVGLFWLKESLISPDLPGVAKVVLDGSKFIRAYGLFPHPNILGGFLLMSILLTLAYRKMFHPSANVQPQKECSTWNILRSRRGTSDGAGVKQLASATEMKLILNSSLYFKIILGVQIVGGILTFSKSTILGLILALAYIVGYEKARMFRVEHSSFLRSNTTKIALFMLITIGLAIYRIKPDFGSIFVKSLEERLVYINISLNMLSGNFLAGIGSGQFVLEMQKYATRILLDWQFQPVHNIFLLIWSELGLIGFSLFVWLIWKLFYPGTNVPRGTAWDNQELQTLFKALLIGFFVIALFDHYLWDIQQGQTMLWLALGLLAGSRLYT